MESQELTYLYIGPDDDARFDDWYKQVELIPCEERSEVTARGMILSAFEQERGARTQFSFIVCFDGENVVGMLKYTSDQTVTLGETLCIHYFAVMPSHQRRGIGQSLLKRLQELASGKQPIFACGVQEPAKRPLETAGFWILPKRWYGSEIHKWSDMPFHKNDDAPVPCDELE
jgi:ribosomal protein S18 acetylase RimI-like enzyme